MNICSPISPDRAASAYTIVHARARSIIDDANCCCKGAAVAAATASASAGVTSTGGLTAAEAELAEEVARLELEAMRETAILDSPQDSESSEVSSGGSFSNYMKVSESLESREM